jgi:hypothetical protein
MENTLQANAWRVFSSAFLNDGMVIPFPKVYSHPRQHAQIRSFPRHLTIGTELAKGGCDNLRVFRLRNTLEGVGDSS